MDRPARIRADIPCATRGAAVQIWSGDPNEELEVTKPTDRSSQPTTTGTARLSHCSSRALVDALSCVAANFEPFVPEINALNVFPVPDGDTGTNMFLTLQAAAQAARSGFAGDTQSVDDLLRAASRGALMGARGNSGVILYQFIEGLAQAAPHAPELGGVDLLNGLKRATELAYQAVINPVEGTMLTVIRAATEEAEVMGNLDASIDAVIAQALRGAEAALARTPEMLPVLKQAGVVDAGGKGMVVILDGLRRFSQGLEPARPIDRSAGDVAVAMTFLDQVEIVHGLDEFGYCTNFLLVGDGIHVDRFRGKMIELGSSAVVVGNESTLKVHVHSEHPGLILEAALEFGELSDVRIDNMAAQTRKLLDERSSIQQQAADDPESLPIAVVAVASGAGLARALQGMGANLIVNGGPTNNPSTQEILAKVERAPSERVIILPNDPNVIGSARQVAGLTRKTVRVVPSRTVPEGITALSAFNVDLSLDENTEAMSEVLKLVVTVAVARASRDASIDGVRARQGEFIGLLNRQMVTAGQDLVDTTLRALEQADLGAKELLTIFVGEPADREQVQELVHRIEERYRELTVEAIDGGQPHYDLILAAE